MSLTTRVITWSFIDCGKDAQRGSVTVAPNQVLTDPSDEVIATTAPKTFNYTGGTGQSIALIDTDNANIQQQGWWYVITVQWGTQPPWTFPAFLPAGGSPVDLTRLSPLSSPAVMAAYLPATGGALSGPLVLAADPTTALGAATKQYVDAGVASAVAEVLSEVAANYLALSGGTVTGDVTIG